MIISMARLMSQNEAVSTSNDIPDSEFLQRLNDAQDRAQSLLSNARSTAKMFVTEKTIPAVANQQEYDIADRLFYNKAIEQIEYSYDSSLPNYGVLRKLGFYNRSTDTSDYPRGYYRRRGKFYPTPICNVSSGSFRVMYERTLDDLDVRRGSVASVAGLNTTTRTFTSFVITSPDETSLPYNLTNIDYVCLCDKDGTPKMYNIPVGSYDSTTNTVTPAAGFVYAVGEAITVGDYVTLGKYTVTHSALPDDCERYLLHYCVQGILHRDSSDDFAEGNAILQPIEDDMVKAVKKQTGEIEEIPQLDDSEWY